METSAESEIAASEELSMAVEEVLVTTASLVAEVSTFEVVVVKTGLQGLAITCPERTMATAAADSLENIILTKQLKNESASKRENKTRDWLPQRETMDLLSYILYLPLLGGVLT